MPLQLEALFRAMSYEIKIQLSPNLTLKEALKIKPKDTESIAFFDKIRWELQADIVRDGNTTRWTGLMRAKLQKIIGLLAKYLMEGRARDKWRTDEDKLSRICKLCIT